MNEALFFGAHRVVGFGAPSFALGDVGDLLAYRQEWEPFISAHLELWRDLNYRFENSPDVTKCPAGIFTDAQIPKDLDPVWKSWCASLALTRKMTSTTDPDSILPRWNAWKDKSSSQILTGASDMLKWHQDVVLSVGGPDKDRLVRIAKQWDIDIRLPPLPTFSTQQEIIARIQGTYATTKGILQIIGYGYGESLATASDVAVATAEGLKDTARSLPSTMRTVAIVAAVAAVVVGGVLVVYYAPRPSQRREALPEPAPT
jgi:hypothetical protein